MGVDRSNNSAMSCEGDRRAGRAHFMLSHTNAPAHIIPMITMTITMTAMKPLFIPSISTLTVPLCGICNHLHSVKRLIMLSRYYGIHHLSLRRNWYQRKEPKNV